MKPNKSHFINRELSWLEFNQRVLEQALYPKVPVLERLKFLAITASNMDEFFMVRVGGLQLQQAQGVQASDPSGLTVAQQLAQIDERVHAIIRDQYNCFLTQIEPTLTAEGLERVLASKASARHRETLVRFFREEVYPVISPMDIDPDGPFPILSNLGMHLCVRMASGDSEKPHRFAIVPLGKALSRFITLPSDKGYSFALLEDVASHFIEEYYPGKRVEECVAFRVTRNADVSVREDSASDLMHGMEEVLHSRRSAGFVRIEIESKASDPTVEFLTARLRLKAQDVFRIPGPLDLSSMMYVADIEGFPALKDTAWLPQRSPIIDPAKSMFETIAERDILLCHPYESFEPVVRFIEEAAKDPDVLAIKQVLYRTSRKSPIVAALKAAAERGKYVTAIVELKARFDEQRNIEWARELEKSGVQVVYGVRGLKTHAKVCIVVRREASGIVRYVHFGTGNYNEVTSRIYSDVSYFTCNESLGRDASSFINAITGYSQPQPYDKLDSAPLGLRKKLLSLIQVETQNKKNGHKAYIAGKMNSLVDPEIIEALYEASQAGVVIRLNVRGVCCLRPGVPGLSENISVVSIVDRFLEHARVLYFYHGGDDAVFISSADWMPRSFDRRVELLVPVEDTVSKHRLMEILDTYFRDNQNSWKLGADGRYERIEVEGNQAKFRAQRALYESAVQAIKQAEHAARTTFEPHKAAGQS
ncbi:MAG: polyphosphate kinase 1 [Pirellula sp.]|jgi:polyphosphate kinase|nr:polyphosphate kinase 1 [Pirellula sp.]